MFKLALSEAKDDLAKSYRLVAEEKVVITMFLSRRFPRPRTNQTCLKEKNEAQNRL
jgi:hypothetical protein